MKKIIAIILAIFILFVFGGCSESFNEIYELAFGDIGNKKFFESEFSVCFVDVGQGDCTILQCGNKTMIIDAGEEGYDDEILDVMRYLNVSSFDIAIGTHDHSDHVGSLDNLIDKCDIGEVLLSPHQTSTGYFNYAAVRNAAKRNNVEVKEISAGDEFYLGEAKITVLAPTENEYEELNDTSIVLKAEYENTSFIFMADAEKISENEIIESKVNLEADVLKVGHHGSNTSSTYHFLRDIMPKYAVISLGAGNSYGHPHEEVMSRLNDCAATVYRTDIHGDVCFYSDGENIEIETKMAEEPIYSDRKEPSAEVYIGNLNSKKYHTPECKNLPSERNRILFPTTEEAIAQGYTSCSGCNP